MPLEGEYKGKTLCQGLANFLQPMALTEWSAFKILPQHVRASIFKRAPLSFSLTGVLGTLRSPPDLRHPHLNQRMACARLVLIASFVSKPGLPWIDTSVFYIIIFLNFIKSGRSIIRAEILISSYGLAAHLNQRVDVSSTMLRLPGVTSSAAHHAYVQIRTRYGGRGAWRMYGGTSGNDETDLSRSDGVSSSAEGKSGSQNVSPLSALRLGILTDI